MQKNINIFLGEREREEYSYTLAALKKGKKLKKKEKKVVPTKKQARKIYEITPRQSKTRKRGGFAGKSENHRE